MTTKEADHKPQDPHNDPEADKVRPSEVSTDRVGLEPEEEDIPEEERKGWSADVAQPDSAAPPEAGKDK